MRIGPANRIRLRGTPLLCALVPLVCIPAGEWITVSPQGHQVLLWLSLNFVFSGGLALLVVMAATVGVMFPRVRRASAFWGGCAIIHVCAVFYGFGLGETVRMRAFHRLAERSKPLVGAVHAFNEKYGHPPESLAALVPEFLPAVPSTGIGAYPVYRYSSPATNYDGNPWVITVFTPSGGISFDQFMYFPLTNYPQRGYGGWLQRVGDWAYLHE